MYSDGSPSQIGVRTPKPMRRDEGIPMSQHSQLSSSPYQGEDAFIQQRIEKQAVEIRRKQAWLDRARRHEVCLRNAVRPMRPAEAFRDVISDEPPPPKEWRHGSMAQMHRDARQAEALGLSPAGSAGAPSSPAERGRRSLARRKNEIDIPSASHQYSESSRWYRAPSPKLGLPFTPWRDKATPGPGSYNIPSSFS